MKNKKLRQLVKKIAGIFEFWEIGLYSWKIKSPNTATLPTHRSFDY